MPSRLDQGRSPRGTLQPSAGCSGPAWSDPILEKGTLVDFSLRQQAARELLILAILTSAFLALFPRRPVFIDLALALLAVSLVLLTARHTRRAIWGKYPVEATSRRWTTCAGLTLILTAAALTVFLVIGVSIAYTAAGWAAVKYRILHPSIPIAVLLYIPWALLQQTLFLFYLLGRLTLVLPSVPSSGVAVINGLAFGLVHLPDPWLMTLGWAGGTVWSALYLRYRLLWPLAISHAVVGTTFFYWVYAYDLAGAWMVMLDMSSFRS